jgi:hypothetical protein
VVPILSAYRTNNTTQTRNLDMLNKTTMKMAERRGLLIINRIEVTAEMQAQFPLKTKSQLVEMLDISDASSDAMVLYYYAGNEYRYLMSTVQDGDFPLTIANETEFRRLLPDFAKMLV